MLMKLLNLALRKGCQGVIRVSLPEGGGLRRWQVLAACSIFSITKLASVTETGEPIAVLQLLRFAGKPPLCRSSKWLQGRFSGGPPPHLVIRKCAP